MSTENTTRKMRTRNLPQGLKLLTAPDLPTLVLCELGLEACGPMHGNLIRNFTKIKLDAHPQHGLSFSKRWA